MTLLELLIVLAILAVVSLMAWPSLRRELAKSQLRAAGRQVRGELARSRLRAMETGTIHEFLYWPGQSRYEVRRRPAGPIRPIISDDQPSYVSSQPSGSRSRTSDRDIRGKDDMQRENTIDGARGQIADGEGPPDEVVARGTLPDGIVFHGAWESADDVPTEERPIQLDNQARSPAAGPVIEGSADGDLATDRSAFGLSSDDPAMPPVLFMPTGRTSTATLLLADSGGSAVAVRLEGLAGVASVERAGRTSEARRDEPRPGPNRIEPASKAPEILDLPGRP